MAPPTPKAPPREPPTNPVRIPSSARTPSGPAGRRFGSEGRGRALDDLALRPVVGHPDRLADGEEPHLLHLVVVQGDVAADGVHQEERDPLADPFAVPHVEVRRVAQRSPDLGDQPRLLLDLTERRRRRLLARFHQPLRQSPGEPAVPTASRRQRHLDLRAVGASKHDTPRRVLEPPFHGSRVILATFAPVARARSVPRIFSTAFGSPPGKYRTSSVRSERSMTSAIPFGSPAGGTASGR